MFTFLVSAMLVGALQQPACLSDDEATARGLNGSHAPALDIWSDEDVKAAFETVLQRARKIDMSASITVYFDTDGSISAVAYREGTPVKTVEALCAAVSTWGDYRWPLSSNGPFRQCGSVHVLDDRIPPFRLTIKVPKNVWCVGESIPATASMTYVGAEPVTVMVRPDGSLDGMISIGLHPSGADESTRLGPGQTSRDERFVVDLRDAKPDQTFRGSIDLSKQVLPGGQALGATPGHYRLIGDYLIADNEYSWSGVVWSNHLEIEVIDCGNH